MIDHLDEAIEKHYLQVYYQPVIRTLTGRLCGAEALIRSRASCHRATLFPSLKR
ncbi:hypothetical protein VSS82_08760 [Lactobacillus delbrueckii subsp. allosunkii]|uniref:hypothetical protein n=1 Tax=Lactobacillus delbrueckii TaxID=1584 RepID=UPI0022A6C0DD|nr:hypothetical protein [Lactobacillus delbrueckii]MCZ0788951.1 hypothetical protein [Lactobacillus delbrueckii subsp. sunkii]